MELRRKFLKTVVATALTIAVPMIVHSNQSTSVVVTFSILGDIVKRIGGKHVSVTTLIGADGDTHVYQPTPADARVISEAKILVVNGLEFEGWLDRLINASDFNGIHVVATTGIEPITFEEGEEYHKYKDHESGENVDDKHTDDESHDHHHSVFDPHAWHSLTNAITYVDNITAGLSQSDPANATDFYQNRAAYITEIKALDAEILQAVSNLPVERRTVITSHDAFQYFGRDYGLIFLAPQGISTENEASAQDIAHLIKQVRKNGISAIFIENITDARLLEQIANETETNIGGKLYPSSLSGKDGPTPTYLDMMRYNATTIIKALSL